MTSNDTISIADLTAQPLPIFGHSARMFQRLHKETTAPWEKYGDTILKDPGLAMHTLQQLHRSSSKPLDVGVAGMAQAAMLLGMERVQRLPTECSQVEELLQGQALYGYTRAVTRAFHAAYQAWDWAHIKRDHAPDEMLLSALLHDASELALWINAPDRIHQLRRLTIKERMPAAEAQYIALGDSLEHFGRYLAEVWQLPPLVQEALRPEYSREPRVQGVVLAVQLARQAEWGWHSPEIQITLEMIAEYLGAGVEETTRHIHQSAVRAAHEAHFYGTRPAAALLPLLPGSEHLLIDEEFPPIADKPETSDRDAAASRAARAAPQPTTQTRPPSPAAEPVTTMATAVCLSPQPALFDEIVAEIESSLGKLEVNVLMRKVVHGMHDGAGLNRALFAMLSPDRKQLQARFMIGSDDDPVFNRFNIRLDKPHLFTRLMEKPQSIRLYDANREKFWGMVPEEVKTLIQTNAFCAQSVHLSGKPVGLFYADRHSPDCGLDEQTYDRFRLLCRLAVKGMAMRSQKHRA